MFYSIFKKKKIFFNVPFYKYLFYISVIYYVCIMRYIMRSFVYDMLVNVYVIYYVHVCEQAR